MLWLTLALAEDITVPGDYENLPEACAEADDGSTIEVASYPLSDSYCTVQEKTLTIRGVGGTVTVDPVQVNDGTVAIENVHIEDQRNLGSIVGHHSDITLTNVTLVYGNDDGTGIYLEEGSTLTSTTGLEINDFGGEGAVGIRVVANGQTPNTVNLTQCTMERNHNGAISITGDGPATVLELTDCTLRKNGNASLLAGGAVYADGALVTITRGSYEDNQASDQGGAVYIKGDLTVDDTTFRKNSAKDGSAIWHTGGKLSVSGSLFIENTVSGSSGSEGGALYSESSEEFAIQDVQFVKNTTNTTNGGAPALAGIDLPAGATVESSRFCGNELQLNPDTDHAGAASFSGVHGLTFVRNVVDKNPGWPSGVTIAMGGSAETWVVEHNTFASNTAGRSTLGAAGGELQAVNNFFDHNVGGVGLYGEITISEHSNAFRETALPGDWSNSVEIQDPAYIDYVPDNDDCAPFPNIQATSDLVNKGSVDTVAAHPDDSGRPDIGAAFATDGPDDTGQPEDSVASPSDTTPPDDGYRLGPASGGCSSVPAPLWLGLLAVLARRSRGGTNPSRAG